MFPMSEWENESGRMRETEKQKEKIEWETKMPKCWPHIFFFFFTKIDRRNYGWHSIFLLEVNFITKVCTKLEEINSITKTCANTPIVTISIKP